MTLPPRCLTRWGTTARATSHAPRRFVARTSSHSSGESSTSDAVRWATPALFTSTSILPNFSSARPTKRSTSFSRLTSQVWTSAAAPSSATALGGGQLLLRPGAERQARALPRVGQGHGPADPSARSGDQRHFPLKDALGHALKSTTPSPSPLPRRG